jgi:hypothetical protein
MGILNEIKKMHNCDNAKLAQTVKPILDNPTKYSVDAKLPHYKTLTLLNLTGFGISAYVTYISSIISFVSVIGLTINDVDIREISMFILSLSLPGVVIFAYAACRTIIQAKTNFQANKKKCETIDINIKQIQEIIEPWLQSTNKQSLTE